MDSEDIFMVNNERDASPERWANYSRAPDDHREGDLALAAATHDHSKKRSQHVPLPDLDELRRIDTASTTSSNLNRRATTASGVAASRVSTQRDLDRHPTELSRIHTIRSQHAGTVGRSLTARSSNKPIPAMGAGKPYPPLLPDQEEYVVEFDGHDDPLHPQNWTIQRKLLLGAILGFTTLLSSFASSIFSAAIPEFAAHFDVSEEVGTLGVSLYVLGFALGPLVWAPSSELYGRRLPILFAVFGFTIFQFGVAVAKDIQTALICRFFGGAFGSCPLAVVAAVFADMFNNKTRGVAITVFSGAVFVGPLLAPFIGGFIAENPSLGWRWTEYIMGIFGALAFLLDLFFMRESYSPVVLQEKAAELRRLTKNWGIHAKQDEIEVDFKELVTKNFSRPLRILFTEPIVLALSIYMAFIYGLLYLFLTAYPIVFQQIHGFSQGVGGLPFLGMVVGMLSAAGYIILSQPSYVRKLEANHNIPVPEWRLFPMILGGVAFAGGLFWFGWSGYRADILWIVPTLSGLLTGFGLLAIFLQAMNYIVDAYLMFAASALAGNTFIRSLAGATFPLFSRYMFDGLGVQWASTLLGCVAVVLVPIPIIFLIYGKKIRSKSKIAPAIDLKMEQQKAAKGGQTDSDDAEKGQAGSSDSNNTATDENVTGADKEKAD